jgi:hypothetical protein
MTLADARTAAFVPREIGGAPSTARTSALKQRYLSSPLMVDIEYVRHLTASNRRTDGLETLERRAEDHAFALEHLTPVIHPMDRIAGNKTRFIRGAVPYANYAAGPFLRELRRQPQDAQQTVTEQGTGGGIALARAKAADEGLTVFSGKFLISPAELVEFGEICGHWEHRCMMAAGERLWKSSFPHAGFIEDGWTVGLYTAPHDPCPEGRLVLDFETAVSKGYGAILAEIDARIARFRPGAIADGRKLHFWRAARRVLEGALRFAEQYALEAERLAGLERDDGRREDLREMADACRHVPLGPPRTFAEAVQSFWFTYLLGHLEGAHLGYSPGRLDRLLQPYFERDDGTSFAAAVTRLEELFVKMTQIEYIASMSWQGLGHGNLFQN